MRAQLTTPSLVLILAFALPHAFAGRARAQQQQQQSVQRLTPPDKNWALDLSLAGFDLVDEAISDDGGVYTLHAIHQRGAPSIDSLTILTVRIAPLKFQGDAASARDDAAKKIEKAAGTKKKSVATLDHSGTPAVRYEREYDPGSVSLFYPAPSSLNLQLHGRGADFFKDGLHVSVGLSAGKRKDADAELFRAVLDSIRFVDTSNPASSFDHYQAGRALFLRRKYAEAAKTLGVALDLERQQRRLDAGHWRGLVEHLADAYGALGNAGAAKEVLDYGVSVDPAHHLFHLGLARFHASRGNLDGAIASLEKASLHREDRDRLAVRINQALIDPMRDPAFKAFHKDEKFRKAVKAMKKGK